MLFINYPTNIHSIYFNAIPPLLEKTFPFTKSINLPEDNMNYIHVAILRLQTHIDVDKLN